MDRRRRRWMQSGGAVTLLGLLAAAGWVRPARAQLQSWNSAAFDSHSVADALRALGGAEPSPSKEVAFFQTPEIAENGAVVPIGVSSNIANTESIAILIDKNPNVLAAVFDIPAGTEPTVATRVKMAQTSNIRALVRAD